jgi:hypothetical protein
MRPIRHRSIISIEASAILEKIWEVAEGGLTDGEPMIFACGNPTRNTGKIQRITFGNETGTLEPVFSGQPQFEVRQQGTHCAVGR